LPARDATLPGTERHPHARAVLAAALPPGGVPSHAYLFQGPAGAGKRTAARAFAAALLAEGAPDPAGVARRVERGAHPDLTWVTPSGAAEMLVADVDEPVVAAAARTPFEARRRVFVLERAETMSEQVANRMLKTLEEPPPFAHLVLLTSRPADILPTVASRCQPVRFDTPAAGDVAARLAARGVEPDRAQACARLALGDAERAESLALGDGPELRAAGEGFARAALHGDLAARPRAAVLAIARRRGDDAAAAVEQRLAADLELLPQRERRRAEREAADAGRRAQRRARTAAIDQALQVAGLWLRDVAVLHDGADDLVHATDRLGDLRADADGRDVHRLRAGVALVDDARAAFAVNPTDELVLEALASRLARESA
jgi:DNA polymerase-3 subunit delta'